MYGQQVLLGSFTNRDVSKYVMSGRQAWGVARPVERGALEAMEGQPRLTNLFTVAWPQSGTNPSIHHFRHLICSRETNTKAGVSAHSNGGSKGERGGPGAKVQA